MRVFGLDIKRASNKRASASRAYSAASVDRLTSDWVFGPLSANEEVRQGLEIVRQRARELERNSPLARKFLYMVEANIVGRGFKLSVEPSSDEVGQNLTRDFRAWSQFADVNGRLTFADMQRLIIRTVARDGECFVRIHRGKQYVNGIALQVLESDFVNHDKNEILADGTSVVMGVYVDAKGTKIAYDVAKRHPGENNYATVSYGASDKVLARDMLHVCLTDRPGQIRAVSWMASIMPRLKMLEGYMEAEIVAARIASCKQGFYKIPPGEGFQSDGTDGATGAPITDASPGVFEVMPTGWEFQQFDPQHPTTAFGSFVKECKRDIAGGLNVAYNNFANDLEGVSYSSIRSGTIEEREQWKVKQDQFAQMFLHFVWAAWLDAKTIAEDAPIRVDVANAYMMRDRWTGRRWTWVDPANDMAAKKDEIALGLTAPSIIADEMSVDYADVQARIKADNDARSNNGLESISKPTGAAAQDTALNGAQMQSLVLVLTQAASGAIPAESVPQILAVSFPSMDETQIAAIVQPLKTFKQTAPAN